MMSDKAKEALRNAMADKKLADEVIALIEAQEAAIADLTSRVEALEAA